MCVCGRGGGGRGRGGGGGAEGGGGKGEKQVLHTLRYFTFTPQRNARADERWKARGGAGSRTSRQA